MAHEQLDNESYLTWLDLVRGRSQPCRLRRRLWLAFSAAANANFRNHFTDKRQRDGWHRNAEFHRHSHE